MRVLIIGSGGREHALSWKVARSGKAEKIYCAPGNGGTAQEGENIPLKDSDVAGLMSFAKGNVIDFVIPGPELPLTLGVVDAMTQAGIRCFGPSQWCAQLEGSKAFAKTLSIRKAGFLPPPAASSELEAASRCAEEKGAPMSSGGRPCGGQRRRRGPDQRALSRSTRSWAACSARPEAVWSSKNFWWARKCRCWRSATGKRPSRCLPRRTTRPFSTATPAPIPGVWVPTGRPGVPDAEARKDGRHRHPPVLAEMARQERSTPVSFMPG